jgi:hypothetical protein
LRAFSAGVLPDVWHLLLAVQQQQQQLELLVMMLHRSQGTTEMKLCRPHPGD